MALRETKAVQLKPESGETDYRRYIYQVADPLGLFQRLKPTLKELDPEELDEVEDVLSEEDFNTSESGLDLFWPQEGDGFPIPVLCSIYFTPFGICLDVMSDDPDSRARQRFESFLEPSDSLHSVAFVPEDMMAFRLLSSDEASYDASFDVDDDDDDLKN